MKNRDRIARLEAIPEFPPLTRGRMPYAGWRGNLVEYEGPLRELGQGIPRPRSRRPMMYRVQRAAWHLALGYASGFPVRDVLAFTVRNFWHILDTSDAIRDADIAYAEEHDIATLDIEPESTTSPYPRIMWAEPSGGGCELYIAPQYAERAERNRAILDEARRRLEGEA